MTRPDRPPGRDAEGDPAARPNRLRKTQTAKPEVTPMSVPGGNVNTAVAGKLLRLRWHYGYLTRAEIEAALGLDPPCGSWSCPGQFGPDGRWAPCCRDAA
jgi:hypothetical protein